MTAIAERRAGVSSMPLSPISASPRATDWSIEAYWTTTNSGACPSPPRDQLRDLDVEADHRFGVARARLDERRAAFGIAGPAEPLRSRLFLPRGQSRREHRQQTSDEDSERHHPLRLIADRSCAKSTRILSE